MDKWQDEIVAEIRAVRDAYAQRFNYDPQAICRDLRRLQEESGRTVARPERAQEVHQKLRSQA